ncbi:hypothetical protein [Arenibacter palladensis]|uniref:hypothetical protein n=1 Tax=Arenibacter palladensis TaxID=237373 RepID=UPI0026E1398B|nr:hypothetical protein [Arenibacter palladensis]MDO6605126.1 hypothetical protein [Arenibacter palladensis]
MVVFLVHSEAALQPAGPFLGDGGCQLAPLFFLLARPGQSCFGPGKALRLEDRILEAVALVEGVVDLLYLTGLKVKSVFVV